VRLNVSATAVGGTVTLGTFVSSFYLDCSATGFGAPCALGGVSTALDNEGATLVTVVPEVVPEPGTALLLLTGLLGLAGYRRGRV
jgi:hypothetical protein